MYLSLRLLSSSTSPLKTGKHTLPNRFDANILSYAIALLLQFSSGVEARTDAVPLSGYLVYGDNVVVMRALSASCLSCSRLELGRLRPWRLH
jgi:hypothetical protein